MREPQKRSSPGPTPSTEPWSMPTKSSWLQRPPLAPPRVGRRENGTGISQHLFGRQRLPKRPERMPGQVGSKAGSASQSLGQCSPPPPPPRASNASRCFRKHSPRSLTLPGKRQTTKLLTIEKKSFPNYYNYKQL